MCDFSALKTKILAIFQFDKRNYQSFITTSILGMLKKTVLFLFFATYFFSLTGQHTAIVFEQSVHDFGTIYEKSGKVNYTFRFKNVGKIPLIIQKITASCGCTSTEYTKTPVQAGEHGSINITFDPTNRNGNFNKTIGVYANVEKSPLKLYIKGNIVAEITVEKKLPHKIHTVRLKSGYINVGKVLKDKTKKITTPIYNASQDSVLVKFHSVQKHINIQSNPKKIAPHEEAEIVLNYDSKLVNDWGRRVDKFFITLNDSLIRNSRITVGASIEEDFSKWTSETIKNAPGIAFETEKFDFDTITQGEKITKEFIFENTGKSDLFIRKVIAGCGCTATSIKKTAIPPGRKEVLKVTFDSTYKQKRQYKTVTVISNAPSASQIVLTISGFVKAKKQ